VPDLFGSMSKGFYTVMEIITLDGWASTVLVSIVNYMDFAPILEILLIITIHFLLINIVNALACNEMNMIYMMRTGVNIVKYNENLDTNNKIKVIKRDMEEVIKNSLEIVGTYENFVRRFTKKRNEKLMKLFDQKLVLTHPEDIQNFYLMRKAIFNNKNCFGFQFSFLRNKYIEKNLKIKTLSGSTRKRNFIFEDVKFRKKSENTTQLDTEMKTVKSFESFELPFDNVLCEAGCELIFRGKIVRLSNWHFLRINNNVRIECREEDLELHNRIKEKNYSL